MNIYFPLHTKRGILITPKMLQQSELDGSKLQTRVMPGAVVTLSDEMATLELVETIISLKQLENELLGELGESCDKSDLGGNGCKQCLAGPGQEEHICLPGWMLKEAGISKNANLSWDIDRKNHVVRFWLDEVVHDLSESPANVLVGIQARGSCREGQLECMSLGNIDLSEIAPPAEKRRRGL